ncbi:hypothetical protein PFICI_08486 [Pestalotiopsis fici W106-1]|uniref:Uncharacterized protein n=1 Tax=Pestalotiopsis fici (strain W106-1 / CGMCC3.15140) TaxID=1229662 RepID=W3X6D5_PESFW|nr:uncharacterized protein PFICI_08486 [Pestalotiopsis fici W106-1]ETS80957.1 hypothetical protein PFICI_08486 [Pestalotiopsis fici W106-1]
MPKQYPGLGLPLQYCGNEQDNYPIGLFASYQNTVSDILPVRELAMMSIMDRLSDKEDWHKKVFDDTIVSKWREEALAIPDEQFRALARVAKHQKWNHKNEVTLLDAPPQSEYRMLKDIMNQNSFDCCIKELQSKARYFEKTGIVPTLDACASIVKADNLVPSSLHTALRDALDILKREQSADPDWHPGSQDKVQDLLHPSMYPLVYGRSRVLKDEVVGVSDAIGTWAGKGDIIPKEDWDIFPSLPEDEAQYWSETYQWLPSNLAFQGDGSVKFTSYINNLHPEKYSSIYRTIEKLIDITLPAWDQCLATHKNSNAAVQPGRCSSRFPYPDDPNDWNAEHWFPSDPREVADVGMDWTEIYGSEYHPQDAEKWVYLRQPVNPEPSYKEINYTIASKDRLAQRFRDSGLQVIVKMASIELTPEKPDFPAGGWHVEGQMNERICATALFYVDSENISPSSLAFRMRTSDELQEELDIGQDEYHWLEQVYGTELGPSNAPCIQNYGSVHTNQGRILAFPNVFQHRVSPFQLEDPTKAGHRRFIALWLVDPTWRIVSTANVPPQQSDWWIDSVFGDSIEAQKVSTKKMPPEILTLLKEKGLAPDVSIKEKTTLPPELRNMVRDHFNAARDSLPMTLQEAKEHRLKLMEARTAFLKTDQGGWQENTYSFCEH